LSRYLKHLWLLPVAAFAVAWFLLLRPDFLGGPASYVIVSGRSMEPGMQTGDLAVLRQRPEYGHGDVVAFRADGGGMVIHRIVGGDASEGFLLRGDNSQRTDPWRPTPDEIKGRRWFTVPAGGKPVQMLQTPVGLAAVAGAIATFAVAGAGATRRRRDPPAGEHRSDGAQAAGESAAATGPSQRDRRRRRRGWSAAGSALAVAGGVLARTSARRRPSGDAR
jgi:signal peptidase I